MVASAIVPHARPGHDLASRMTAPLLQRRPRDELRRRASRSHRTAADVHVSNIEALPFSGDSRSDIFRGVHVFRHKPRQFACRDQRQVFEGVSKPCSRIAPKGSAPLGAPTVQSGRAWAVRRVRSTLKRPRSSSGAPNLVPLGRRAPPSAPVTVASADGSNPSSSSQCPSGERHPQHPRSHSPTIASRRCGTGVGRLWKLALPACRRCHGSPLRQLWARPGSRRAWTAGPPAARAAPRCAARARRHASPLGWTCDSRMRLEGLSLVRRHIHSSRERDESRPQMRGVRSGTAITA